MRGSILVPFVALVLISWVVLPSQAVTYTCPKYNPLTRNCNKYHSNLGNADYVPTSNPLYMPAETCKITNLPTDLTTTVNTLFPEGQHPDPAMIKPDLSASVTLPNSNISFTYVSTGAGYKNRLGFAKYDSVAHAVIGSVYPVFPAINSNDGSGCLQKGDTYKFGPFNVGDVVIFYLDADSQIADRFWSLINNDFHNPDTTECSCTTGYVHGSWAYLSQDDITLFGFEDLKLGDADYNDVMFFLTVEGGVTFNEIPEYENKTLKICNPNTTLAERSFSVINCTVFGVLEAIGPQSCLTYMSIPVGYTWARDDDPLAKDAIRKLARTQWAYTGASCFVLSTGNTTGIGYDYNLNVCPGNTYTVNTIYNATSGKYCYNTACSARYVLKGANLGTDCGAAPVCNASTVGQLLAFAPAVPGDNLQYPTTASVFMKVPGGAIDVPLSLAINKNTPRKKMDLIVFIELTSIPTNRRDDLNNDLETFWRDLDGKLDFQMTLALTYKGVGVTMDNVFYSLSHPTALSTFKTRINNMVPSATAQSCGSGLNTQQQAGNILNSAFPWRPNSYKAMYIMSACATTVSTNFEDNAFATGIRTYFFTYGSTFPTGWEMSQYYSPTGFVNIKKGSSTWQSGLGWSDVRNAVADFPNQVMLYVVSDPSGFIPYTLPTYESIPDAGYYGKDVPVRWPAGIPNTPESTPSFLVKLRIIGRDLLNININFNHKPIVSAVNLPVNGGVRKDIDFAPTDPDANIMTLTIMTYPTFGNLYLTDGTPITAGSIPYSLPPGNYRLSYESAKLASGNAFFTVRVSDGCAYTEVTVKLTVTPTNTPPAAVDFSITIYEDSLWNAPATNGLIDFTNYVSDDEPTQTLTVSIASLPPSKGVLRTYSNSNSGSAIAVNSNVGTKQAGTARARFVLNQPRSGWGVVSFNYRVYDGLAYSLPATVTINVIHVNHAPVLTVPVTKFKVAYAAGTHYPISATITDEDGTTMASERVNLRVVAATFAPYRLNGAGIGNQDPFVQADSTPASLFTSSWASPSSSSNFPVTDFTWDLNTWVPPGTAPTGTVTIQAFDQDNLASNQVTLTFDVTPLSPPTWFLKPNPDYTIAQGAYTVNLPYRATDADGTEWNDLIFNLTTVLPTGHKVYLVNGANLLQISTGTEFRKTTSTYVTLTNGDKTSDYFIRYEPPSTYYGTFSFSFTVRDATNLYANEPATTTIHVTRRLEQPISDNCVIRGYQETLTKTLISAYSQNDFANNEVVLEFVSKSFVGQIFVNTSSTTWSAPDYSSPVTAGASVSVWVLGDYGIYSPDASTPIGSFTFRPVEPGAPSNNVGSTYTCQIILEHVNKPPTSRDLSHYIKKREVLHVVLPASDPDADDPPITITGLMKSATGRGNFYRDAALTIPLDSDFITAGGNLTTLREFWYVSMNDVSTNNRALASYSFIVADKQGEPSVTTYIGNIYVTYAGDEPTYGGSLAREVNQETPLTMALKDNIWTEGPLGADATVLTLPTRGTLSICDENSICTIYNTLPPGGVRVNSPTANVIFLPQDYDWDRNFTSFDFQLTDIASSATGVFTMYIHVIHVNKRPFIEASNFLTTAETSAGVIVNESSSLALSWRAWDQDSLPSTLRTLIRATFYTTQGFSLYSCTGTTDEWVSNSVCTFDAAVPFAVRADFIKNARRVLNNYETVTTSCPDFTALRAKMGAMDRNCETHFKLNFVPTPDAFYTPYVTLSLSSVDDYETESNTISVLILVKSINSPPTITSPPLVLAAAGVNNPFIRDTDQNSPSFNNPVIVDDVDSLGNVELLVISVDDTYSGNLQWPASAPCEADPNGRVWYCRDRIKGFNQWLTDLRFEVTSGERADITFVINDLGYSSDYKPSPNMTAEAKTTIRLLPAIAAPKGNSQTLAIAVGVAAAAGLLLLGALGFFLRKAVSPPTDDYFAAATTPLSAAPQSPLYQPQNTTHENALYKGM